MPADDINLVSLLARLVFNTESTEDASIRDSVDRVIELLGSNYRSPTVVSRNGLGDPETPPLSEAGRVVLYGLAEQLAIHSDITLHEKKLNLLKMLQARWPDHSEEMIGAIRALSGTSAAHREEADRIALKQLQTISELIASNSYHIEHGENHEDIKMPHEMIRKVLDVMAFDEARLPERLHYTKVEGEPDIASDGQVYFLTGVAQVIRKISGDDVSIDFDLTVGISSLLLLDGHHNPDDRAFYDHARSAYTELLEAASDKRSEVVVGNDEMESNFQLKAVVFKSVTAVLTDSRKGEKIFFHALASVYRGMLAKYDTRPPGSTGFSAAVHALYNSETLESGGGGGGGSGIAYLDLPPLSEPGGGSEQIVARNIEAIASIYVVYQCEQMLLFDVVDRIVELFMAGLLPMGGGVLARKLDDYYWANDDRISKLGRQAQFTRALGAPGGDVGADVTPNMEFNPSLLHVISSLSEFERQRNIGNLFENKQGYTMETSGEYVRKAVRDLAANCTLYGYAGAQFSAERLGRQLAAAMEILQLPRIKEIYGVNSMWQVIERVAQSEFGTTVNVVKHRTLAEETKAILELIAAKASVWSYSSAKPLFTINDAIHGDLNRVEGDLNRVEGDLSRVEGDRLFRASQYFLAVNGVQTEQVYQHSQRTDTPALPSIPGMGAFGPSSEPSGGVNVDVAGQLKSMLDRGVTPSPEQISQIIGR